MASKQTDKQTNYAHSSTITRFAHCATLDPPILKKLATLWYILTKSIFCTYPKWEIKKEIKWLLDVYFC